LAIERTFHPRIGLDERDLWVGFPTRYRRIFPPVKAASAVGLLAAQRFPALGRLTTAMLTLHFALAVGSHIRARDIGSSMGAAGAFLATFASMTVLRAPHRSSLEHSN
jgi:hypothetical protein